LIVVVGRAWGQAPPAKTDPFAEGAKAGGIVWASGDAKEDARGIRGLAPITNNDAPIVYSPDLNPFVAVGEEVYDLTQGKLVGKAPRSKDSFRGNAALSPNGKWFAHELQDPQSRIKSIVILDTATGEKKHEVKFATSILGRVLHLTYTANNHLACVTHEKSGSQIQIVSMDTGKPLKKFDTKDLLDDRKIAFSSSGQYMAAVLTTRLVVFDVIKGKEVAEMETPAIDTGHPFIFVESLAFSPDTSELASLMSAGKAGKRLLIWARRAKSSKTTTWASPSGPGTTWTTPCSGRRKARRCSLRGTSSLTATSSRSPGSASRIHRTIIHTAFSMPSTCS
jgi:hypothetical protein